MVSAPLGLGFGNERFLFGKLVAHILISMQALNLLRSKAAFEE